VSVTLVKKAGAGTVEFVQKGETGEAPSSGRVELSLKRMRECAVRAHADTLLLTGELKRQAETRRELFAQSAADLAGTTVQQELALAADEPSEPVWSLSH